MQPERKLIEREQIEDCLRHADIPILLMVLVHLTGDETWLKSPFLPRKDTYFFANESGGLPLHVQKIVREAAANVISDYHKRRLDIKPEPSEKLFLKMMRTCVSENIPREYLQMMLEEMSFRERDPEWGSRPTTIEGFKVLIIGAGMSGICAAIKFKNAGIPFEIVEKNGDLGGTWHENKYPEVGCDVPNHYYSYSFWPNLNWSRYFSKGQEIEKYLKDCASTFGLTDKILFNTRVISARYLSQSMKWKVLLQDVKGGKEELLVNFVVSATGHLNQPKIPSIPGLSDFEGDVFHTARWPNKIDLAGKRVALIGTGASSMQLARTTAQKAKSLLIFQRSKQWAIPTRDYHREVGSQKRWLFRHIPHYLAWYRFATAWRYGDHLLNTVEKDPDWAYPERSVNSWNDNHRMRLTNYIKSELGSRTDLLEMVLPDYPPYAKRILIDNHWYRTLQRDNVELINDSIDRVTENSLITSNNDVFSADTIILATGFGTSRLLNHIDIRGRDGITLHDMWGDDDSRAYLGMTVPEFPNFFCLYGPNTNSGHGGSIIFIVECQIRFILSLLMKVIEKNISEVEVRNEIYQRWNELIDEKHAKLIWTHPGVDTWYRNKAGRVVSIMPFRLVDYWRFTKEPNLKDYLTR